MRYWIITEPGSSWNFDLEWQAACRNHQLSVYRIQEVGFSHQCFARTYQLCQSVITEAPNNLCHQRADFRKLDFHFNASLAAVNLAKAACKRLGIAYSISSCKLFIHNAYMLERFICAFGINPDQQVIDKLFKGLILFTARAA